MMACFAKLMCRADEATPTSPAYFWYHPSLMCMCPQYFYVRPACFLTSFVYCAFHSHTHVHTHMCTHSPTHTHVHTLSYVHTHMCTHSPTHTHVHTHMCTHSPTHTHVHTLSYTHTCAHTLLHTHMCTHSPTHTAGGTDRDMPVFVAELYPGGVADKLV